MSLLFQESRHLYDGLFQLQGANSTGMGENFSDADSRFEFLEVKRPAESLLWIIEAV